MIASRALWWFLPLLATALAYRHSPQFGFLADAPFLIPENRFVEDLSYWWATLTHDYFWSSSGNTIPYWRPFTKISWLLEHQVFGDAPMGYHLVQVVWHLLGVGGVMVTARALSIAPMWSAIAGTLYGLHAAAIEAVCLIMARSDVTSATAVIWSIAAWLRWRQGHRGWLVVHVVASIVALTSKESALVLVPLLAIWTIISPRRQWLTIIPIGLLAIIYVGLRHAVLAHHDSPSLSLDPLRIFVSSGEYLWGVVPLKLWTGVRNLPAMEARSVTTIVWSALSWLLALGSLMWFLKRKNIASTALLLWLGGSLAPVLLVSEMNVPGVAGKYPLADRWLLQAAAAACLIFSTVGARLFANQYRHWVLAAVTCWAVSAIGYAEVSHSYYATEQTLTELEEMHFQDTPDQYKTQEDTCRHELRKVIWRLNNGQPMAAAVRADQAPKVCQSNPLFALNRLKALVAIRQFQKAQRVSNLLLKTPPKDQRFAAQMNFFAGLTFLETADPATAEHLARKAQELGLRGCDVLVLLARAAGSMGRVTDAYQRFETAFECQNNSDRLDATVVLAAIYWSSRANQLNKARKWLKVAESMQLNPKQREALHTLKRQMSPSR